MKYLAILDEDFLSNFELKDAGLKLVLTDKEGKARETALKPIIRPVVASETGESLYLTQGHIDCLLEYEKQQTTKEIVDSIMKTFDDIQSAGNLFEGVCNRCEKRNYCEDYQASLIDHTKVLFGCTKWEANDNDK